MSRPPLIPGQLEFELGTELVVAYPLTEFPALEWELKSFSGTDTKCPKCGSRSLRSVYEKAGRITADRPCYPVFAEAPYELSSQVEFPEHLDRSCNICAYAWVERTRLGTDAEPEQGDGSDE